MEATDPALTVSLTKLPTGILLQLDKSHVNVALLQSTRLQALAPHDVQLPRAACRCTRRMDEATAWVLDRAHLHLARVCETTLSAIPTAWVCSNASLYVPLLYRVYAMARVGAFPVVGSHQYTVCTLVGDAVEQDDFVLVA
jgi:hypothetical protein